MLNYKKKKTKMNLFLNLPGTSISISPQADFWTSCRDKMAMIEQKKKLASGGKQKNQDLFWLLDGPPYSNGPLHLGHALNKILKDAVLRRESLEGKQTLFLPGWDTHGLPIESKAIKLIKQSSNSLNQPTTEYQLKTKCLEIVKKTIQNQKAGFNNLLLLANFEKYYATYQKNYLLLSLQTLKKLAEKGKIVTKLVPKLFSFKEGSVIPDIEVEFKIIKSLSVFLAFTIFSLSKNERKKQFLVWTTTPWTLLANQFLAINANENYISTTLFPEEETNIKKDKKCERTIIFAKKFLPELKELARKKQISCPQQKHSGNTHSYQTDTLKEIDNSKILKSYYHSLWNKEQLLPCVSSDLVMGDVKTGILHGAPAFGPEDYQIWRNMGKKRKDMIIHINEKGKLKSKFFSYFYDETNKAEYLKPEQLDEKVISYLSKQGKILATSSFSHSYPFSQRSQDKLFYYSSWQQFILIQKDIIEANIAKIKKINWVPIGKKIEIQKLNCERNDDWCISRQRVWGTWFPLLKQKDGKKKIAEADLNEIIKKIKKSLNQEIHLEINKKKDWDVLDVWFDSAIAYLATKQTLGIKKQKANLVIEGKDQLRGWFSYLITLWSIKTNAFRLWVY